jgi:hypothetical protein
MAVEVFDNAFVSVNAVDLSDHVESVTLEHKADMLEETAMGDTNHQFLAGLKDWSLEVVFFQDYAAGSTDATLNALIGAAAFALILRPDTGTKAVTNPEYTANAVLESHSPLTGGVGTLQKVTARFRPAGALARATA